MAGHWAHEDQTLPSGQLGSVNLISVGLSQRSSHLRSHPKYLIRNQLESLLCLPGPGSFPIYIPSLSCWCCTRQRAMCNVRCGHVTHYIQGVVRGRFTSRHQGSLRTSKIKTAVRRNWVARAYVSIGVPPSWRLGLITRSNLHSSLCFRRDVCWFSCTQLFLSLGAGVLKEVVSSALSAAAQDVLLQL